MSYLQVSLNIVGLGILMFLRQEHQKENMSFYNNLAVYSMILSVVLHSLLFLLYVMLLV